MCLDFSPVVEINPLILIIWLMRRLNLQKCNMVSFVAVLSSQTQTGLLSTMKKLRMSSQWLPLHQVLMRMVMSS